MAALRRLRQDFKKLQQSPPPGVTAGPSSDSNFLVWSAVIFGPGNTPFEGGVFKLRMEFPLDYPNVSPKVTFLSKMFHPNVYRNGRVCLDILEEPSKWTSEYDVGAVLCGIQAMLGDPNPESPANSEANELFQTQPAVYEDIVINDIVYRSQQRDEDDDADEEENENELDNLRQEEMERQMNELAIKEALEDN